MTKYTFNTKSMKQSFKIVRSTFKNWAIVLLFAGMLWMGISFRDDLNRPAHIHGDTCRTHAIDTYLNLLWIFACIFALFKVTELTERFVRTYLMKEKYKTKVLSINAEWENTLKMFELDKKKLDKEMQVLRKSNLDLEEKLLEQRNSNLQLINENFTHAVRHEQQLQALQQQVKDRPQGNPLSNIYITNRHVHFTRQFYVNNSHVNLYKRNSNAENASAQQTSSGIRSTGNVWVQYLKMRKFYMGPSAQHSFNSGPRNSYEPIIMTTEEMAKLQGLI